MPLPRSLPAVVAVACLLASCRVSVNDVINGVGTGVQTAFGQGTGALIRSKRTSSLSNDLSTVTLSIEAASPDGSPVTLAWQEPTGLGTLNADRGANVQWAAKPGVTGTAVMQVTATAGGKTDTAEIRLPVTNGRIKLAELTPEVTLSPQSATLFRPLPTSLGLSEDQLLAMGISSKVTLSATTFRYNAATNEKEKTPYDPGEVRWQTGDPELLTVGESGTARPASGSKVGDAIVQAISKTDASQRASALVRVRYLSTKIDLAFDRTSLAAGTTLPLRATVTYTNPEDRGRVVAKDTSGKDVTWESSDKTKAQVDDAGTVKALADAPPGSKVTITARSAYDPSVAEKLELTIQPAN